MPSKNPSVSLTKSPRGGGGGWGATLIFSYIRRLGSFVWVQNFEFQYFLTSSRKRQTKVGTLACFDFFVKE